MRTQVATALLVAGMATTLCALPAGASSTSMRTVAQPAPEAVSGAVRINDGAAATRSATITLAIAAPTGSASLLRVSNDGGTTWVPRTYGTSFTWSLVDEAAGGVDEDGAKTVTVEAGDGAGPWTSLGSDGIVLDRAGPVVTWVDLGMISGWRGYVDASVTDAGVGVLRTEISLDGTHWRSLKPSPFTFYAPNYLDYREGTIGGSWDVGPRSVYVRGVDDLGNVGQPFVADGLARDERSSDDMPAVFELPLPAVAGQPFTVKPVFDAGYRVAAGQYCHWGLKAGSMDVRLEAGYDETLVSVQFWVPPRNGVCEPWTFTLPYTPPLEYTWSLGISGPANGSAPTYVSETVAGSFRAAPGSTSRAITYSSLPLYYMLPDRDLVDADGTVTYRLRTAGGAPYRDGLWYCHPAVLPPHVDPWIPQEQHGGWSFRCRVNITGPWVAEWYSEFGWSPVARHVRPDRRSARTHRGRADRPRRTDRVPERHVPAGVDLVERPRCRDRHLPILVPAEHERGGLRGRGTGQRPVHVDRTASARRGHVPVPRPGP